jgi:nucleotide-binding universal stress UspA family protein
MRAASSRQRVRRTGTTFENILVCGIPLYDAPILLRQAASVITPGDAAIRLLESPTASPFLRAGVEPLERVVESLSRMGVLLQRQKAAEGAAEDIVQQAIAGGHDLVVKGVAAEREGQRTLTPVDLTLVRRCPCPVWFVECAAPRAPRRIVAAVDPEADEDGPRALAVRVATLGAGLADTLGAELHVLHAWLAFGEHLLRNRMSAADLAAHVGAARETAERTSKAILGAGGLELPPVRVHFHKGEFTEVLPQFVADGDFDLIIIGTRGRKGWLDSVIRPHAESALSHTDVSVLVVRLG